MHGRDEAARPVAVVLGGTGWLGRHVREALTRHGHDVTVVARRPPPEPVPDFVRLDLTMAGVDDIRDVVDAADVVVNATDGANATDGWDRTEADLAASNVAATQTLLDGIVTSARSPRLVHVGTVHEYGAAPWGATTDESTPPAPLGPYARTKLAGSRAVLDAITSGSVDGVVVRLVNLVGPHPSPASFPGKLLDLAHRAASGETVDVPVARSRRDLLDVRDAARACSLVAAARPQAPVLNVGSGLATPMHALLNAVVAASGTPPDRFRTHELGGHPDWVRVDNRLVRRMTGWSPAISLTDSARAMWEASPAVRPIDARQQMEF